MLYVMMLWVCLLLIWTGAEASKQPNIIFIFADDMGWNDVSFHGSDQIPTPNIDALAYNGVILNSHYVQATCTPSRAALMTGKYPIRTGMQGYPILAAEPRGLPDGKILPQYLKDLGYSTHAIGKWHLGYHHVNLTPTYRGFDSHMGYYNGFVSYFDYILQGPSVLGDMNGFDLRRNLTTAWDLSGRYATDVFTEEAVDIIRRHDGSRPLFLYLSHLAPHAGNKGKLLEAPQSDVDRFKYIADPNRRTYAAMVYKLDESVGRVVQTLRDRSMLHNSIIVFLADNGAPTVGVYPNWGSNWPLRGVKETLWEGGVRGVALIWSPLLRDTPRVSNQLVHVTDWLPTLYTAAGGQGRSLEKGLDGVDQWKNFVSNRKARRVGTLLNIDEKAGTSAYRWRNWKLIRGSLRNGTLDGYYGDCGRSDANPPYPALQVSLSPTGQALIHEMGRRATPISVMPLLRRAATVNCPRRVSNCHPRAGMLCLFNMDADPCELNDLSQLQPGVVSKMLDQLKRFEKIMKPQSNIAEDIRGAHPRRWNNTWSPWVDCQLTRDADVCNVARL